MKKSKWAKRIMHALSLLGLIGTIALFIYFFRRGVLHNPEALQEITGNSSFLKVIVYIGLLFVHEVIPIVPGGVIVLAGVALFGAFWGSVYNCVGIVAGSYLLFFLGRVYGESLIKILVNEKTYQKYLNKLHHAKRWDMYFFLLMLSPVSPDGALILITSLTKMSVKRFSLIILIGKPVSIIAYTFLLEYIIQFFKFLFHW